MKLTAGLIGGLFLLACFFFLGSQNQAMAGTIPENLMILRITIEGKYKPVSTAVENKEAGDMAAGSPGYLLGVTNKGSETETPYRFEVSPGIEVTRGSNRVLSMDQLPVPCEAIVHFLPLKNGYRNAYRIEVVKTGADATVKWQTPDDE